MQAIKEENRRRLTGAKLAELEFSEGCSDNDLQSEVHNTSRVAHSEGSARVRDWETWLKRVVVRSFLHRLLRQLWNFCIVLRWGICPPERGRIVLEWKLRQLQSRHQTFKNRKLLSKVAHTLLPICRPVQSFRFSQLTCLHPCPQWSNPVIPLPATTLPLCRPCLRVNQISWVKHRTFSL